MKLINSDDKPSNHDKNFQQRGYPIRTTLKKKKGRKGNFAKT